MSRTRSPHHCIFKGVLNRAVNLITNILNSRVLAHNQSLIEIGFFSLSINAVIVSISKQETKSQKGMLLPFCVKSHKSQFLPDSLDNILHAEIKLTTHDSGVRFTGKSIKEFKADAINLVVDV
jgi:hypothetical protein